MKPNLPDTADRDPSHNAEGTARSRLMLAVPYFYPRYVGGVTRLFDLLLSNTRSHDVTLLTDRRGVDPEAARSFDERAPAERGYRVRRMPAMLLHFAGGGRLRNLRDMLLFLRTARREFRSHVRAVRPDVLVSGNCYALGWMFNREVSGPLWVNYILGEELTLPLEWGPVARWVRREQLESLRRADLNIAISRFSANLAIEQAGLSPERVVVIPCPVDTSRFTLPVDRERLRADLGWEGRTVLLTIARLVPRKGIDHVLKALSQSRGLPSDFLYVIGGTGPQEPELRRLCADLGLADRVRFVGFIPDDDLARYYGAADLFVQTNRAIEGDNEGFGIVYLEANACGTPVIGGTAGGTGGAIEDGVSGLRVDGDDVEAIRRALEGMLGDPVRRAALGRGGYERVHREFTVARVARAFEDAVASAGAARRRSGGAG